MKITSIYSVFWILSFLICIRKASATKCIAGGQQLVNGTLKDCPEGFYGCDCKTKCFPPSYGVKCKLQCVCNSSQECHHILGCLTTTTSGLKLTDNETTTSSLTFTTSEENNQDEYHNPGFSTSATHLSADSNKWVFNYIIIMAVLLTVTFMFFLLRTKLSRSMKTVHKTHDEAFQLRVANCNIRLRPEEHVLVQHPSIEILEDAYSEIRESQMIRRVSSLSQINTLMNGSIVESTRNKSRSSDIYNHLEHSLCIGNIHPCFESEYTHAY